MHPFFECAMMTFMDILYIIIPAYNEEDNIRQVIEDWYPVVERHDGGGASRLVLINDGSVDDTYKIICECALTRPLLQPLTKENSGHGSTLLYGYRYALKAGADYIFQTDSDGQTLASEFEPFWAQRISYDMLIGRRKHRADGKGRVLVSRVLRLVLLLTFRVWIRDANCPYRLLRAQTLASCIDLIPRNFALSNVLMSVIYARRHFSVRSLPVTFRPRQGGMNSINARRIAAIGIRAVRDFRVLRKRL